MHDFSDRHDFAVQLCRDAGALALQCFRARDDLVVDTKGAQDWVSNADRDVETFMRTRIGAHWPADGIVGEEHGVIKGSSGFVWVIDPIDGTTNFVNGIPQWTVVLAGVAGDRTQVGVIHDPNFDESFAALCGQGATLNGAPLRVAENVPLAQGTVSIGYSSRILPDRVLPVIAAVIGTGALYHRNASGALSLAYVAAGRLVGYVEEHMNAWDCLAGQLLIEEAGGRVEQQSADEMIRKGGRVIAGTPTSFPQLLDMAEAAWAT